jgi:hypothetical protein
LQGKDMNRCFQFINEETYSGVKEVECLQAYMHERIFLPRQKQIRDQQKASFKGSAPALGGFLNAFGEPRIRMFLDIHTHSS